MSATWGIVMTVREPAQLVLANVAWHLGTGASEIHVYLDDPRDPIKPQLDALGPVRVTCCDAAHWRDAAQSQQRPASINRRQGRNAVHAMVRANTDWLIHLDADEFLFQERPLANELAVARELDCEVHFPVHERFFCRDVPVHSIFDGLFRTTTKGLNRRTDGRSNDAVIFGAHLPVLNNGVLAHSAGKCAAPTDSDFRLGLHWSYRGKGRDRAQRYRSTSTRLLHFDGLTRLHWLGKLMRYRDTPAEDLKFPPHRLAQIGIFQDIADDPEALAEFHREFRELEPDAIERLRDFGLLYETPFDPVPMLREVLGDVPDLSSESFDRDVRRANPGLLNGL
ncbi:glycosyltransferase family 2 protein [Primorskyibacter aestuariivivens]|uniref:glycosyltransferase family 2 protein n=1 Tax=Primorskyibacter aestuariivivens TaxID=1888912 RepID=UPI002301D069|nr:glycosyltransferase family 2 protein [Primorskyibacter aestuariivivens]MDA7427256.1 glycosyltransferase family 2 protein [Primorskyibacter aestuariivivens]